MPTPLQVYPVVAPLQTDVFDLAAVFDASLQRAGVVLQDGDIVAVSSKYMAIAEGRVVSLQDVVPGERAVALSQRYNIHPAMAQLVIDEATHIFGGIPLGFLLTQRHGIIAPNAGIDRSNIPMGNAVLLPAAPYESADALRRTIDRSHGVRTGVIVTDSWLMPGRYGTSGVAVSASGFAPIQDERGREDLFGNPMQVTQRGIADSLCVCAQMVMGERAESTPFAVIRDSGVVITGETLDESSVAIPWQMDIYVESLTVGLLASGAPDRSFTRDMADGT